MVTIAAVLTGVTTAANVAKGAYSAYQLVSDAVRWLTSRIKKIPPDADPDDKDVIPLVDPGKLMAFVYQLGITTDADVDEALANWASPKGFTDAQRAELTATLKKLVHGAKFHSTHGTKLSHYVAAEKLLEQLLDGAIPKRRLGEKVEGWELKAFLGMGGFGEVWRAENPYHPDTWVFKFFTQPGGREWMEREATVMFDVRGKLKHCVNVIDYLNVQVDAQPDPYLVLEFATLGTLEDWILTPAEERAKIGVTELMKGIVRGVSDAHKHGIHHRDLKPANVLLTGRSGDVTPKVADFGLGSVTTPTAPRSSYRSQAVLVGTQLYLPPEAANPYRPRDPAQDDVFALGVIWFQVLTGHLTRPAYDFADELSLAGADSRSIKLIGKCLASPKNRYPSACELYADMDADDPPPGPGEWAVPDGCFDVAGIAREYLERTAG
jgi:hypothetical protein